MALGYILTTGENLTDLKRAVMTLNNAQLHLINSRAEGTPFFVGTDAEWDAQEDACPILGSAKLKVKAEVVASYI